MTDDSSTNGRLAGRVAVITGAGRGIGRAIALAYAREGARVALSSRTPEQVRAVAEEIAAAGGTALAMRCDVTVDEEVDELRRRVVEELGGPDVVVNNAGVHWPAAFLDYDIADWQQFVDANVLSVVRVLRAFLPPMLERGRGKVVNVASTAGKYGSKFQSPYNATKHAVVGLTRCLALEYAAQGIQVNAICPGFVRTDLIESSMKTWEGLYHLGPEELKAAFLAKIPAGRFLEPDEVAALAVYLGAADSDGMTGQALTLSGGLILV